MQEMTDVTVHSYTEEELRLQIKPLPSNKFARFFVNIYRRWLEIWYGFSDRHPKGSSLIQKAFLFFVFSMGVTVWQYIVMTFLPYAFVSLNDGAWGWPNIPIAIAGGEPYIIFGDAQGLGYFIAFEIAVFTAQCINFPFQRNITYRSHGNPYVQALWYFIGWIIISVLTNALWGICNVFLIYWGVPDAVAGIGKTGLTGGLSMVVFFFIFLIIFPDNVKLAKKSKMGYEKALSRGESDDKLAKLEQKTLLLERRANIDQTERELHKATSQASATAMRYFALKQNKRETEEDFRLRKEESMRRAFAAIEEKKRAKAAYETARQE